MKNKHFDKYEFIQALSVMNSNPYTSRLLLEEYIHNYPTDYSAYAYYADNLIYIGDFKKAEEILNTITNPAFYDNSYNKLNERKNQLNRNILYPQIKLLSYQHKYQKLYNLCNMYSKELRESDINGSRIIYYCQKKLGLLNKELREGKSYFYRQIYDYQESDLIEHLNKHTAGCKDEENEAIFSPDIDVIKLISEVKKNLQINNRLYPGFFENIYYFKLNNCGKVQNKFVDFFKVVCLDDTDNIITMYPTIEGEQMRHTYINYTETKVYQKIKTRNQIDRFNQKWNNNKK